MLRRGDFVVLGLGKDAKLPELLVEVFHEFRDPRLDGAKVMIVEFLSLRGLRAKERPAAEDEVLALVKHLAVNKEVFLLGADGGLDAFHVFVAKELQNAHRLLVDGLHRAQQRRFLVERLTAVRAERRRDAEHLVLQKRVGRGVPSGVAACLKRCAQAAGRKAGRIRLALDELFAGKLHNHAAVGRRGNKAIVLLGGNAGQRLEPVGKMRRAVLDCPVAHGLGYGIGHLIIQTHPFVNRLFEGLVDLGRKSCAHDSVVKHQTSEIIRNRLHVTPLLSYE